MQFTTKDLLVTVLPKTPVNDQQLLKDCLFRTYICKFPTYCAQPTICRCSYIPSLCGACSFQITCGICSGYGTIGCGIFNSCGPGRSACDPTIFCPGGSRDPFVIQHAEDLVTLKAELQATLKSLDAIQREGLPSAITSKAEADALERSLTDALNQVRAAKKNL
jgi:hypothetical protein